MDAESSQPEDVPLRAREYRLMGDLDVPDLDLPAATDEQISAALRGMGGGLDD
ncbi:hypothetical protein [Streptomyces sp. NBC_01235]|uniref:hypothetical protein n=1 Tax=Streptomyces sp. NBC_01235 TaxID=2903788 RepID=UPI002E157D79|nr:hypothetical protein OG289_34570 [Streptomyces sp. NBC_01235]